MPKNLKLTAQEKNFIAYANRVGYTGTIQLHAPNKTLVITIGNNTVRVEGIVQEYNNP